MKGWIYWVIAGVVSIICGVLALANPFAATITVELIVAWMFLFVGILQIFSAFLEEGWRGRLWAILIGILNLLVAIALFTNPVSGAISLTVLVAVLFLAIGGAKVVLALQNRQANQWWLLLLSGIISIILATMMFTNMPAAAAGILGVLLGVELLSNGIGLVSLGMIRKRAPA